MNIAKGLAGAALLFAAAQGAQAATLDVVRQRGAVTCGTTTGFAGFSAPDAQGKWQGLDVDLCRAIAAAVFGDADKIKVVPLNSQQRFTALQSGEVDVLLRTVTLTQTRDTSLGLSAVAASFYDGQGILVNKKLGVKSAKELNGATVCVQPGTTTELNLADWFRANNIEFKPVVIDKVTEVVRAFESGRCDAFTDDASQLAAVRATQVAKPDDYEILPERFSKEPLGPMVRQVRELAWHRPLDAVRAAGSRGIRHHAEERGRDAQEQQPQRLAHPGRDAGRRQEHGPGREVGLQRHQGRGQLQRSVRAQRRQGQQAGPATRHQRAVEQGRRDVPVADPLSAVT